MSFALMVIGSWNILPKNSDIISDLDNLVKKNKESPILLAHARLFAFSKNSSILGKNNALRLFK